MSLLDENPFSDPSADLYVWSADGVVFKLHKVILSLASEYFKDIFSPSQFPTSTPSRSKMDSEDEPTPTHEPMGPPSLHFPEESVILDLLFRLCYPVDDPPLDTIDDVRATLEAAKKYRMREAVKITRQKLLAFAATEPMRVYAIAWQLGLEDMVHEAAKEVRKKNALYTYAKELEDLPASAYRRLLSFCEGGGSIAGRFLPRHVRPTSLPTPPPSDDMSAPLIGRTKSLSLHRRSVGFTCIPKTAPHPFNAPDADIILTSSDNVLYRVYKNIIELASPVIASKLAGVQLTPSERRLSLPQPVRRLSLPESGQIITILLRLIYPMDTVLPTDVHTLYHALRAAQYYQMQKAVRALQDALTARADDQAVPPEQLYAIACRCDLRTLAQSAARRIVASHTAQPLSEAAHATFDKYSLSAGRVQQLLSYNARCREAARYVVGQHWRTQLESSCRLGKWAPTDAPDGQLPCWYERYMSRIAEDEWPTPAMATNPELLRAVLASCKHADGLSGHAIYAYPKGCKYCSDSTRLLMFYDFTRYVAETMEALENKVTLDWPPAPLPTV